MKRYYQKNCRSFAVFLVVNLLAAASSVLMSFLLGLFADSAMEGDFSRVGKIALVTLCYLFVETGFSFLMEYTRDVFVQRIGRDLRADAVRKIERLSETEKSKTDDGSLFSLMNNDIDTIQQEYLASLGAIYFQICCFVLAVGSALVIQPLMTLIMILVSILPVVFPKLTEKRLQSYKEAEQQAKAQYASTLTQIFSGFLALRVFHAFDGINRFHDEANDGLCQKKIDFRRIRSILYAGAYGCGNLVFLGTWVVGLFFAAKGLVTLPALIAFSQLMTFVAGPVQIISERYATTVAAAAVCKRVRSFLNAPTDETIGWGGLPLDKIESITLRDICCRKEEHEILRHIDVTISKGARVALLGESGSGKSTLLKVLAAMCTADGAYEINGRPVRDYDYTEFRRQGRACQSGTLRAARPWIRRSEAMRTHFPAARSGGSIWPARFGSTGAWSCWMNRPPAWMRRRAWRWNSKFWKYHATFSLLRCTIIPPNF